jgi:hypothetical protein
MDDVQLESYILADFEIYSLERIRFCHPCMYVASTCFVTVAFISVITKLMFNIASSLLYQCIVAFL